MNTRFNPTVNGLLHLGHLYLAKVNYHTAKANGGKFVLRFDDAQPYWVERIDPVQTRRLGDGMYEDLCWAGIPPDIIISQRQEQDRIDSMLLGLNSVWTDANVSEVARGVHPAFQSVSFERGYPYVPIYTARKVLFDYEEGCDLIIRGEDLVSEFGLYCHFCRCLDLPLPVCQFIPKLLQVDGNDLSDVSKTTGWFKIREFREKGVTAEELDSMLRSACLKDNQGQWLFENIKRNPVL